MADTIPHPKSRCHLRNDRNSASALETRNDNSLLELSPLPLPEQDGRGRASDMEGGFSLRG